jgi:antitoxin VapB
MAFMLLGFSSGKASLRKTSKQRGALETPGIADSERSVDRRSPRHRESSHERVGFSRAFYRGRFCPSLYRHDPMSLNIKSDEAHRLARELARRRRSSLTEAVTAALHQSLRSAGERPDHLEALLAEVREVQALVAALPDLDPRDTDATLGYDERGLPT